LERDPILPGPVQFVFGQKGQEMNDVARIPVHVMFDSGPLVDGFHDVLLLVDA
jgi:hypothetical protein